jgi:hypothetical protein
MAENPTKNQSSIWNILRGFGFLSHMVLYFILTMLTGAVVLLSQNQKSKGQFEERSKAYYPLLRKLQSSGSNPASFRNKFNELLLFFEFSKVGLKPPENELTLAVNANNNSQLNTYQKKQASQLDWTRVSYDRLNDNVLQKNIRDFLDNLLTDSVVSEAEGWFYIIDAPTYEKTDSKILQSFKETGRGNFDPRYIDPEKRSGAIVDSSFLLEDAELLFKKIDNLRQDLAKEFPEKFHKKIGLIPGESCVLMVEKNKIFLLDNRGGKTNRYLSLINQGNLPDGFVCFDTELGSYGGKADDLFFADAKLTHIANVKPEAVNPEEVDIPGVVDYYNNKVLANELCRKLNDQGGFGSTIPPLLSKFNRFPFKIFTNNPERFQVVNNADLIGVLKVEKFKKQKKKPSIETLTLDKLLRYWQFYRAQ